jgi:hypothetical protein
MANPSPVGNPAARPSGRSENSELVGRQGPAGEPGDLFTAARYADFELEAEWKMRWPGNSGFWFKYQGPRTGCQADFLDQPSEPGILSGSVYCMGLKFVAVNRDPKTVRKEAWNRLRIRMEGDRVQVWMNGARVVNGTANIFPGPGQLGLQVHAGEAFQNMEIRVRNARFRRQRPRGRRLHRPRRPRQVAHPA